MWLQRAGLIPAALLCVGALSLLHRQAQLPSLLWLLPLLVLAAVWRGGRWQLLVLVAVLGLALWRAELRLDDRLDAELAGTDQSVQGWIVDLPQAGERVSRFVFAPADSRWPRRLRLSWYDAAPRLVPGQCWELVLRLKPPRGSVNPGGFDYAGWLLGEGIGGLGYVRSARRCADDRGGLHLWRHRLVQRIRAVLGAHPSRGFVLGLTVGDRSEISDLDWRLLRRTGTSHLMAISGLHLGLLAGLAYAVFWRLWAGIPALAAGWPAARAAALAALAVSAVYAALSGWQLPAQRALLMTAVALGAIWVGRWQRPFAALAVAALGVLIVDPWAVRAPGFWLSFAAVACIVFLLAPQQGGSALRRWWRVQWGLALLLIPLTLAWFGEASLVAPLANLVLVPLFALLLPLLLIGLALLATPLSAPLLRLGADILELCRRFLGALADLPGAAWLPPAPEPGALLLAGLGLLLILLPRAFQLRLTGLVCLLPLLLHRPPAPAAGQFELTVLDVGQGLSVIVRTAQHSLVYDAGPAWAGGFDAGSMVLVPALRAAGVQALDTLVISHGDLDHRGGAPALVAVFPAARRLGHGGESCRAGQRWHWDGVEFEILHPDGARWRGNDASCVLRIAGADFSALLPGDIEAPAEAALLAAAGERLRSDLLVVPHHGSLSSSTRKFLSAVAPRWAAVSTGHGNRWGFPRPEVRARHDALGATVLVTAEHGALRFSPGVQQPVRWREQAARYWHAESLPDRYHAVHD